VTTLTPPLAETFARLRAFDELCRAKVGTPGGKGWLDFADLPERGLDELLAAATRPGPRRPHYIGASVAATLVDALVSTALPALLVERRLPDVSPANVSGCLHHSELWFTRLVLNEPRCHVLPADAAAQEPSATVVPGAGELHRLLAGMLVEAATPWFDAIRARTPFGRRGMWGQLADDLCSTALRTARAAGLDQRRCWDEAQSIVELVAADVPDLRVRPRLFPVRWSGGQCLWQVKGTCCLWYTTFDEPQTDGDGYCTTCPLRTDDVRHQRLREWLENQASAAG
jgi:hypothetical protein